METAQKRALTTTEELAVILDRAAELLEALAEELNHDNPFLTDGFDACIEAVDTLRNPGRVLSEPDVPSLRQQVGGIRQRIEKAKEHHAKRASILTMLSTHIARVEKVAQQLEKGMDAVMPKFDDDKSRAN